jgi:hypothetical protein
MMRRLLGWVLAAGLLIVPASRAQAQLPFSFGYSPYGVGYPAYGNPGAFGGYAANGLLPAASFVGSSYSSFYAAPGTTSFVSGTYTPYLGAAPLVGYGGGYPGPYGYGFAPSYVAPSYGRNSRWVSTGPFMGLPRPGGGLVRVPW